MSPLSGVQILGRPGSTIVEEIAAMLADEFARAGVIVRDPSTQRSGDLVVLVGQGPEFGDLEDVRHGSTVLFWELDPLPPPGLSIGTLTRGVRATSARERVLGGALRPIARVLPRSLRRLVRRTVAGRDAVRVAGAHTTKRGSGAIAFRRLHWICRNVSAGRVHRVMCTSPNAVAVLGQMGVSATVEHIPYHPSMGRDERRARDLDAVFLGQLASRPARAAELDTLGLELSRSGIALTRAAGVYGDARAALLNRAKVALNLRSNTWQAELLRFVYAAACGALVVSEAPISGTEPFEPGRHFVATTLADAPDVIQHYVRSEHDRQEIVAAATELVTTRFTMGALVGRILDSERHAGSTRNTPSVPDST